MVSGDWIVASGVVVVTFVCRAACLADGRGLILAAFVGTVVASCLPCKCLSWFQLCQCYRGLSVAVAVQVVFAWGSVPCLGSCVVVRLVGWLVCRVGLVMW